MRFILSLSALAVSVLGALTPEQIALAAKYAPQFRLTPNEKYFPSSIEYMLPNYKVYDDSGKPLPTQPSPLTASNLDSVVGKGASTWLTIPDTSAGYLTGQNPSTNKVPVIFFPYNLGKNIIALGWVGNHIGDWERMTVRTLNGVAISADYNAHSSGNGAGSRPWADVLKPSGEDRPLGYVASGSHGVWPGPGSWVYEDASTTKRDQSVLTNISIQFIVYKLKDETSDGGPIWNAKDNVYPIEYLSSGTYSGDQSWINFQGSWGNKGQTNCWWYKIVKTCPLSNGPGGPYRSDVLTAAFAQASSPATKYTDMKGPLSQTLAPLAINSSTSFYKLRLDESVLQLIDLASFSHLTVEQTCLEYRSSTNTTLLSSTHGSSKLSASGDRVYSLTVPRCTSNASHVDSYRVGLCTDGNNLMCSWAGYRQLRTYLVGRQGVMNGTAINLDMDHDNWTWD